MLLHWIDIIIEKSTIVYGVNYLKKLLLLNNKNTFTTVILKYTVMVYVSIHRTKINYKPILVIYRTNTNEWSFLQISKREEKIIAQ